MTEIPTSGGTPAGRSLKSFQIRLTNAVEKITSKMLSRGELPVVVGELPAVVGELPLGADLGEVPILEVGELPVGEVSAEENVGEVPAEENVREMPAEENVEEMPVEENVDDGTEERGNTLIKSRAFWVASAPWPAHIYDQYSIASIIEKAQTQLAAHKIHTMPTDPTQSSMIANTFKEEYIFSCRYCSSHIANCRELFAMSKHGVQTQYFNSAGYVHETNTLYQVNNQAILYSGAPSAEFSWFPGCQWHSIVCKVCKHHLGWEFKVVEPNLVPKQFFGISSSSVRVRPTQSGRNESRIRSVMRLNTMPMIGGDNDRDASTVLDKIHLIRNTFRLITLL
uniref:CULT domain-containing protein n=1 Tax=Glossina morsitans morsitans TaxID=37546 RepID=A0A1B0FG62_GLOMM